MQFLLQLNEWLNTKAPAAKRLARLVMPMSVRRTFADQKFSATISDDSYDTVFKNIYHLNWWGSSESVSGYGSELGRTASIRHGLSEWCQKNAVQTLFDAPCGDFNWIKEVIDNNKIEYLGGDIVPELVKHNQNSNSKKYNFRNFDILVDDLPDVDAWICRDVLFHFPNNSIQKVLDRFKKSNIKYLLTTHFENVMEHHDIEFGKYRPVNLCKAPFNWPPPSHVIFDGDEKDRDRYLGIWPKSCFDEI